MKDCFEKVHELLRAKHYETALNLILNSTANKIKAPYHEDLNHAWFLIGSIYTDKGNYEDAISAFKKSLEDWPEDDQAMSALAYCYMETGNPFQAQKQLEMAIQRKQKEEYYYNLANSFFDQCKFERAIELYKKISRDEPSIYQLAQKNIGHAIRELKKLE